MKNFFLGSLIAASLLLMSNSSIPINDFDTVDESCTASCYANITYEGEYVTTVYSSSTAADCATAQISCLSSVSRKARAFVAAQ